MIDTRVLACTVFWTVLLALTVISCGLPLLGAVNNPVVEIVPAVADQTTAVLLVFLTVAENWILPVAGIDGSAGEITIASGLGAAGGLERLELCIPLQPVHKKDVPSKASATKN